MNSNIRCIEILQPLIYNSILLKLNSNIRCIEILLSEKTLLGFPSWIVTLDVLKFQKNMANMQHIHSWIVTLDVLKYKYNDGRKKRGTLNSNIRCIEMVYANTGAGTYEKLNSNIRCIEIKKL